MDEKIRLNDYHPFLKFLWLLVITVIGSIDYKPFLAILWLLAGVAIAESTTDFRAKGVLRATWFFWVVSCSFMAVISLTRYLSGQRVYPLVVLALGMRILLISFYSGLFVKTTDPSDFVLALIHYFKVPPKFGYAFLTAYRFLPTFKDELDTIKYAHQVRGIKDSKNPVMRVWNSKRYTIPMMAVAIRKGVRVTMAMETRAFGKYKDRTYLRRIPIKRSDIMVFGFSLALLAGSIILLGYLGCVEFGLTYKG